jgi:hypothetical protein
MMMSVGIHPENSMNYRLDSTELPVDLRIDGTALDLTEIYTD